MNRRIEKGIYRNRKRQNKRTLLITCITIVVLIGACITTAAFFTDSREEETSNQTLNSKKETSVVNLEELGIDKNVENNLKNYTNIALLGVDARQDENIEEGRTDAIIIVSINNETGEVSLISVARDSYLLMESQNGDEILDKATHAHVFGGPKNTIRMLNKSLDLNIKHYVVLNWNSVVNLVDAAGGITIDISEDELYDLNKWGPETASNTGKTWTEITETGSQKIDGVQAATYCRIRKTSGGDNGRMDRMKKVINAVFQEVKSNPTLVTKLTNEVFNQVTTNISTKDVVLLTKNLLNFKISNNVSYPYNYWGGTVGDRWVAIPTTLEENNARLHSEIFGNEIYESSQNVKDISEQIIIETGVSIGTEQ